MNELDHPKLICLTIAMHVKQLLNTVIPSMTPHKPLQVESKMPGITRFVTILHKNSKEKNVN